VTLKVTIDAAGMENADAMILELRRLGASTVGAALYGLPYPDSDTNTAAVIRFLADGVTRRDGTVVKRPLGPSQADADEARAVYLARVRDRLALMRFRAGMGKAIPGTQAAQAEFAQSSALKAAAEHVRKKMQKRAESQTTTGGTRAASVTPEYAEWRQKKFFVPASAVFKRAGLLLKSLGPGNVRVNKSMPMLQAIAKDTRII
jgi:hypothetical protein